MASQTHLVSFWPNSSCKRKPCEELLSQHPNQQNQTGCILDALEKQVDINNKKAFLFVKSRVEKLIGLNCSSFFRSRDYFTSPVMAHSKWEYVKKFELEDTLLPNCFAVARVDGRGFHKLAKKHNWTRPNDIRALKLMNEAAISVMKDFEDVILGYGQSDEYSFVFRREADIFERRSAKIITTLVSKFSSAFVFHWSKYFPETELLYPPSFDGRMVLYPTDQNLRDYLCWRQADCHINNLYNTTFWSLVLKGGMTNSEAEKRLSGTLSRDKNEILFSQFGINYNNEPEMFKKGTVLVKKPRPARLPRKAYMKTKQNSTSGDSSGLTEMLRDISFEEEEEPVVELNCDIIGDKFWTDYPHILKIDKNDKANQKNHATDSVSNDNNDTMSKEGLKLITDL